MTPEGYLDHPLLPELFVIKDNSMTPRTITIYRAERRVRVMRRRPALGANNPRRRRAYIPAETITIAHQWEILPLANPFAPAYSFAVVFPPKEPTP